MQLEFKQEVQHQLVLQLETSTTSVLRQLTPLPSTQHVNNLLILLTVLFLTRLILMLHMEQTLVS